jgi:heme/copper-type cytochrome/quinol oxidase subunit 1
MDSNHKRVGIYYLVSGFMSGWLGFIMSLLIRIEMFNEGLGLNRQVKFIYCYNNWISMHGLVMLFMFVMPIAIGGYGNYLLPILVGSNELVMPRLNAVSFYLFAYAGLLLLGSALLFTKYHCSG